MSEWYTEREWLEGLRYEDKFPEGDAVGDRVDVRRVEAVAERLRDGAVIRTDRGRRAAAEVLIAAADEAVGGVVSREDIADDVMQLRPLLAAYAPEGDGARVAEGCELRRAIWRLEQHLAAYCRDATRDATG